MTKNISKIMLFIATLGAVFLIIFSGKNVSADTSSPELTNESLNISTLSSEETEIVNNWAGELEYILTNLFAKDSNGKYQPTEKFYYSHYTRDEKAGISRLVMAMNGDEAVYNGNVAFRSAFTDWASRCFKDTFNIGAAVAMEIAREVEKGNFLGAASKLFVASKAAGALASHPMVSIGAAVVYLSFCGAPTVS
ncbi:TPA: hypothetical protein TXV03_002149 [Streptococcus suis]|nr:hypothetical protein [Streptococcus suis]HEL1766897.1 hypothetical protein [Streptococcus suis]HEM5495913.1 hypothetical protein [Streptococcus suis]